MRRAQLRSDPFADNAAHLPGALRGAIKFIVDQGTEVPAIRERQRASTAQQRSSRRSR